MITLYLVRHGETVDNLESRLQGHTDSPLTDLGVRQAQAIAERLSSESFAAMYSSDLGRARATADIIATPHGLSVQTSELLREANLGLVQGMTTAQFVERYHDEFRMWRHDPVHNRPPGGERLEQVIDRCREFLTTVLATHSDGDKVVIVCHGGSLRGLICAALDLPVTFYAKIRSANAGLSILELANRHSIRLLNDTCHLDSLKTTEADADNPTDSPVGR